MISIYTDGSYIQSSKSGGWAYIILNDSEEIIYKCSGSEKNTTNQKMEMVAVIEALKYLKNLNYDCVKLFSDSAYIVGCFKERWFDKWILNGWLNYKNKPVSNKENWVTMIDLYSNLNIEIEHIKSKSNKFNKIVDKESRKMAIS